MYGVPFQTLEYTMHWKINNAYYEQKNKRVKIIYILNVIQQYIFDKYILISQNILFERIFPKTNKKYATIKFYQNHIKP